MRERDSQVGTHHWNTIKSQFNKKEENLVVVSRIRQIYIILYCEKWKNIIFNNYEQAELTSTVDESARFSRNWIICKFIYFSRGWNKFDLSSTFTVTKYDKIFITVSNYHQIRFGSLLHLLIIIKHQTTDFY